VIVLDASVTVELLDHTPAGERVANRIVAVPHTGSPGRDCDRRKRTIRSANPAVTGVLAQYFRLTAQRQPALAKRLMNS